MASTNPILFWWNVLKWGSIALMFLGAALCMLAYGIATGLV